MSTGAVTAQLSTCKRVLCGLFYITNENVFLTTEMPFKSMVVVFLIEKEMEENVSNKGNISCTLKCMNVKYIYIAVTQIELLLNQTIVACGKAIKKGKLLNDI